MQSINNQQAYCLVAVVSYSLRLGFCQGLGLQLGQNKSCSAVSNQLYDWQTHGVLTLMMMMRSRNNHCHFHFKQWLLSIDMKTKVVQHVPKIIFNVFKLFEFSSFQLFRFSSFQVSKFFKTFLVPSFCLTFRDFFC